MQSRRHHPAQTRLLTSWPYPAVLPNAAGCVPQESKETAQPASKPTSSSCFAKAKSVHAKYRIQYVKGSPVHQNSPSNKMQLPIAQVFRACTPLHRCKRRFMKCVRPAVSAEAKTQESTTTSRHLGMCQQRYSLKHKSNIHGHAPILFVYDSSMPLSQEAMAHGGRVVKILRPP